MLFFLLINVKMPTIELSMKIFYDLGARLQSLTSLPVRLNDLRTLRNLKSEKDRLHSVRNYAQINLNSDNIHMSKATEIMLTLKAPITTAADDIHKFFSLFFRENKT